MDHEEIEAFVEHWAARLQAVYGLQHWDITFEVDSDPDADCKAQVTLDQPYERATITLFSEQLDSEDEVLESLMHELEHVLDAPWQLYRNLAENMVNGAARRALEQVGQDVSEIARSNIGRFRRNIIERTIIDCTEREILPPDPGGMP